MIRLQYKGALYVYQRAQARAMKENEEIEEFFSYFHSYEISYSSRGSLNRRRSRSRFICNAT